MGVISLWQEWRQRCWNPGRAHDANPFAPALGSEYDAFALEEAKRKAISTLPM
jgi:hypothetical protein